MFKQFSPVVERWRPIVAASAPQLLIDFVLSIIRNESGGAPGIQARRSTKFERAIPSKEGGTVESDKALGLMQTIPLVVEHYNQENPIAYWEDMTGDSTAAAKKQIQVGLWALNRNIRAIEATTGTKLIERGRLNLDTLKLALVAYAWGIGRTKKKLKELKKGGRAPTFENLQSTWPTLGEPANRPIKYANRIVNRVLKPGPGISKPVEPNPVANISLIVLGGLFFIFSCTH